MAMRAKFAMNEAKKIPTASSSELFPGRVDPRVGSGPEYFIIRRVRSGPRTRTRPDTAFLCRAYAHTLTISDTQLYKQQ